MMDLPGQFAAFVLNADPFIILFEPIMFHLQSDQLLLKFLLALMVLAPVFFGPLVSGFPGHTGCFADAADINIRRKSLLLEQLPASN